MSSEKRKPNWTVCVNEAAAIEGSKPRWREIGAAWETSTGNLWMRLNDGERLEGVAMLFPYREKRPSQYAARTWRKGPATRAPAYAPDPPAKPTPFEGDYMERKRTERQNLPQPPAAQSDTRDLPCDDPDAPDWL